MTYTPQNALLLMNILVALSTLSGLLWSWFSGGIVSQFVSNVGAIRDIQDTVEAIDKNLEGLDRDVEKLKYAMVRQGEVIDDVDENSMAEYLNVKVLSNGIIVDEDSSEYVGVDVGDKKTDEGDKQ